MTKNDLDKIFQCIEESRLVGKEKVRLEKQLTEFIKLNPLETN